MLTFLFLFSYSLPILELLDRLSLELLPEELAVECLMPEPAGLMLRRSCPLWSNSTPETMSCLKNFAVMKSESFALQLFPLPCSRSTLVLVRSPWMTGSGLVVWRKLRARATSSAIPTI